MALVVPPIELWSFRSFRSPVEAGTDAEIGWDWLGDEQEALVVDVSYSTPRDTRPHAIVVDWYDPTSVGETARKVVAQVNDNAVFWNPVRWFVPRVPGSSRRWVLRARCAVPASPPGLAGSLDVSVAIVRSGAIQPG